MKLVINSCYGGFSLSRAAVKRFNELKGRTAYFFRQEYPDKTFIPRDEENGGLMDWAFDVPNPNDFEIVDLWDNHYLTNRPGDRGDPDLVRAIEELGSEAASGSCAKLKIVEIPDQINWELDEYDGIESVHQTHQSWS